MVLYDFLMIVKSSVPKNQLGDILRRTGTRVLDAGGVITDVTSYGTRTLAYEFKTPGEKHFEAHTVQMSFNCAPTVLEELKHDMRTDERVLRWIAVKDRALKPLKNYPARDPRNPLNVAAMTKDRRRRLMDGTPREKKVRSNTQKANLSRGCFSKRRTHDRATDGVSMRVTINCYPWLNALWPAHSC